MTQSTSLRRRQRRAAAAMETAVVVGILLMFMFGIMEYCRFLFYHELIDNAVREGARYAVVHTLSPTVVDDTKAVVTQRMAGTLRGVQNFTVSVYRADSTGANTGAATDAQFGEYIGVQVNCDYSPVAPSFLLMGQTIPIQAVSLMYSEAN